MENHSSIIRGLINDLLRSLSAALIHVDDLIMKIEKNSDQFSDAMLTNKQLSKSVELFLDLRSECNYFFDQLSIEDNTLLNETIKPRIKQVKHGINELVTSVLGACDLMFMDEDNITDKINLINNIFEIHIRELYDNNNCVIDNELLINSQKKRMTHQ